ncbi:hypothetical protein QO002_003043 [Pararhizobium capsulatum DSM 1112]|uniref:Transcriptional regulator n=1 Tax=Pararhizobium capsulatum DSM 1112 TaxID=1121113 RepID=A0ABU0BRN8_9HYPH|nr:hypothetical protein [Pararhizobium capsulatum]MDQ0320905.1 hypothetical protein [Pararhizobium capsulatum DSM 1112]
MTETKDEGTALKKDPLTPAKLSARDKAAATDEMARAIIAAESSARDNKTEKLRALRLQQELAEAEAPPPPAKRASAPKRRAAKS